MSGFRNDGLNFPPKYPYHASEVPAVVEVRPESRPKVALKVPILLVVSFLLAAVVGVAHHFFYSFLDGRSAVEQAWIFRAGTAIAYLAKLLFAAAIGTAFTQLLWMSLRSEFFTLGAIDDLFDLRNSPWRVFNLEVLSRAKLAVVLAVIIWALPVLPIIAPGSILVKAATKNLNIEIPIQTLNFSRTRLDSLGSAKYPVDFVETFGVGAAANGYYEPSPRAKGLVYSTVYGGRILNLESPCGANCTFTQSFIGPAYSCQDIDYTRDDVPGNPFCHGASYLNGTCDDFARIRVSAFDVNWYRASNSSGDACANCNGAGWRDGKLWVEYRYLLPSYRIQTGDPPTNATPIPDSAWENHQFMCQSYNANHTVERAYTDFEQAVQVSLVFLDPLNYSYDAISGFNSDSSSSYAGYAIHQLLYSILFGEIGLSAMSQPVDNTGLAGTQLVEAEPFPHPDPSSNTVYSNPGSNGIQKPVRDLRTAIEQLHFNITFGMLSIPNLIYIQNGTARATRRVSTNRWTYNWNRSQGYMAVTHS